MSMRSHGSPAWASKVPARRRCCAPTGVLSGILAGAVKGKRLAANPAKGIEGLPRKTATRHVYLSAQDVARLADESGEHRALVLVLAYCGLRWGEAIGLRVRDVEFLRRRLSVSENAVQIGARHAVGPTKGRKARSVPVPTFVLDELSLQCARKAPAIWCSVAATVATSRVRSRLTGGSGERSRPRVHRRSLRMICATPARRWRCRQG
jgi:integrase